MSYDRPNFEQKPKMSFGQFLQAIAALPGLVKNLAFVICFCIIAWWLATQLMNLYYPPPPPPPPPAPPEYRVIGGQALATANDLSDVFRELSDLHQEFKQLSTQAQNLPDGTPGKAAYRQLAQWRGPCFPVYHSMKSQMEAIHSTIEQGNWRDIHILRCNNAVAAGQIELAAARRNAAYVSYLLSIIKQSLAQS